MYHLATCSRDGGGEKQLMGAVRACRPVTRLSHAQLSAMYSDFQAAAFGAYGHWTNHTLRGCDPRMPHQAAFTHATKSEVVG